MGIGLSLCDAQCINIDRENPTNLMILDLFKKNQIKALKDYSSFFKVKVHKKKHVCPNQTQFVFLAMVICKSAFPHCSLSQCASKDGEVDNRGTLHKINVSPPGENKKSS